MTVSVGAPDNSFIYGLLRLITEWREDEQRNLAGGAASDWPDYRRRVGRIEASHELENLIIEQLERWQKHLDR